METRDKRVGTKMKTEETTKKKLKVGIFGITGCMGCQLNILYQKQAGTGGHEYAVLIGGKQKEKFKFRK